MAPGLRLLDFPFGIARMMMSHTRIDFIRSGFGVND